MSKRVLITGGNKGIGLAAARRFLQKDYQVIVIGRNFEGFEENGIQTISYDLSNLSGISDLIERIGDIDVLVNNAGIDRKHPYDDYPEEDIEKILNVNLRAPLELINGYAKRFIKKGAGRVVNVASQAGEVGHTDVWYGITKAGLLNVTKSYAALLGGKGVIINAVAPGPVDTEMIQDSPFAERFEKVRNRTILKRIATKEEVAEVIFWLGTTSPEYVNGETIDINNGAQRIN